MKKGWIKVSEGNYAGSKGLFTAMALAGLMLFPATALPKESLISEMMHSVTARSHTVPADGTLEVAFSPKSGVTIHSDQGSQISSHEWQSFLKAHNLVASRRGNCDDNAVVESFFQLLKRERIRRKIYADREEARRDIFDYIELFYNPKRRHSYTDGFSPVEFDISTGSKVSSGAGAIQFTAWQGQARCGLWVIYSWCEAGRQFWLFTAYDKDEMEGLSPKERKALRDISAK